MKNKAVASIFKKSGFKRADLGDKVTSVLAELQSTHDAVFVFDEQGKFAGIVNLYHSFLRKKADLHEKVERCLYNPPVLTPKTTIFEAARLMVESRVYRLPVLEEEKLVGVVFAEDILKWAKKRKFFNKSLERGIVFRPPIFIENKKRVDQAVKAMIDNNTNRLLVTDKTGKHLGILTLYDLRKFLARPEEKIGFGFTPIKKEFAAAKVEKFYNRFLVSVTSDQPIFKALDLIRRHSVGSVVVYSPVDSGRILGTLTLRDFLKLVANFNGERGEKVTFSRDFGKKSLKLAKEAAFKKINTLLKTNALLAQKVKEISLDLKEIAKGGEIVRLPLLEATAKIRLVEKNKTIFAKVRGRKVVYIVNTIIHKVRSLLLRRKD